tara:strand:+ start:303 stop:551 length:249 start_codon:yes stop_codon:yes gene_type:complete
MESNMKISTKINWVPLENLSERKPNEINCCDFMHMGAVGDINLYKSRATRSYINIDTDGGYWRYHNGEYYQIDEGTALRRVN